ncbi:FAD-binding domain-containing protein [Phenylobacterium parvum]|uniref:DNA photolyase FAD-binding protein n=1 Tax=Phenylobacterium parvum TaxID=2201350 RepID=A0A2Z3HZ03_9CAUL|nr:FAD-binding domain-containing protein [Phenylobacterium parvum]AWM78019.1 DNA photolyase FAD-binding protein [Phenylobacterium parvum]
MFPPIRQAALERLTGFVPAAGRAYAEGRNLDPGPGEPTAVSRLSPYLRHRVLSEAEVVDAVVQAHGVAGADKFIQEVLWRTYWKGWLEMRPSTWSRFLETRDRQRDGLADVRALADAEAGRTGIEGFDDWACELARTGYLHNHARMWFASIWIFTLRLPWALGADLFLRRLIDADPASNTLSWRWVAGLQTPGKTYLATRENIARFTGGRFAPSGLATDAFSLVEAPPEPPAGLPPAAGSPPPGPFLLLATPEDLTPELGGIEPSAAAAAMVTADPRLSFGEAARRFTAGAARDAADRLAGRMEGPVTILARLDADALVAAAQAAQVKTLVTPFAPVGPTADALAQAARTLEAEGLRLIQIRRDWDSRFWPHATAGFVAFRKQIPALLEPGMSR